MIFHQGRVMSTLRLLDLLSNFLGSNVSSKNQKKRMGQLLLLEDDTQMLHFEGDDLQNNVYIYKNQD